MRPYAEGGLLATLGDLRGRIEPASEPGSGRVEFLAGLGAEISRESGADGRTRRLRMLGREWTRIETADRPVPIDQPVPAGQAGSGS